MLYSIPFHCIALHHNTLHCIMFTSRPQANEALRTLKEKNDALQTRLDEMQYFKSVPPTVCRRHGMM